MSDQGRFDTGHNLSWLPAGTYHLNQSAGAADGLVFNVSSVPPSGFVRLDYASVVACGSVLDICTGAALLWGDAVDNYVELLAAAISPSAETLVDVLGSGTSVPVSPPYACTQLSTPFILPGPGHFHLRGTFNGAGTSKVAATVSLSVSLGP